MLERERVWTISTRAGGWLGKQAGGVESEFMMSRVGMMRRRTCARGASRTVGREDGGRLIDGQISAGDAEVDCWGARVDEAEVLRGQVLCEQLERLCRGAAAAARGGALAHTPSNMSRRKQGKDRCRPGSIDKQQN